MEQLATPIRTSKGAMGQLVIHSTPSALRPHIEWALQNILGTSVIVQWKTQPLCAGTYRATITYRDRIGIAHHLSSALRAWHYLRFEITESAGDRGEIFRFTPDLGLHRASIDGAGSILLDENRITHALAASFDEESLRFALESALGTQWDEELEMYRGIELQEVARLRAI